DASKARGDDRRDDRLAALVALPGFVERNAAVEVHEDLVAAILLVDLLLIELADRLAARHATARAVVDGVGALHGARFGHEDVAVVAVRARDEDGMPRLGPHRSGERWMAARERARRAL